MIVAKYINQYEMVKQNFTCVLSVLKREFLNFRYKITSNKKYLTELKYNQ